MTPAQSALLWFLVAAAASAVFGMVRNYWVYRQVMKVHAEAFDRPSGQWWELGCPGPDDLCVGYDAMLWRFWIWDREKFRTRRLPPPAGARVIF